MSAPRSDFNTQSLVLSIDVYEGIGISPLRMKHFAEFISGRCCLDIRPGIDFFVFFSKVFFFPF